MNISGHMLFWDHDNRVCIYIYCTSMFVCAWEWLYVCQHAQPALSLVQPDMEAAIWRVSMSDIKRTGALILHSILFLFLYSCFIVLPLESAQF